MKPGKAIFPIFFLFLLLSLFLLFFFQNPLTGWLQDLTVPIQRWTFGTASHSSEPTSQEKLQQENNDLRAQLAKMQEVERDNKALHDQFQTTKPNPKQLLPAVIVGMGRGALLIDKGTSDHVKQGNIVVVKDTLIGTVTQATDHLSLVTLLTNPSTSFTAKSAKTNAVGVIKSQGSDSLVFDNVILSDKLEKNDVIITKGDMNGNGAGFPPDLVVGKIVSVSKNASSLFQSAKVESLVDVSALRMVFVLVN